tara:strand:+ start:4990 stop:5559 length:570 start_codon:yes stop_codon:yes gene_type:complete
MNIFVLDRSAREAARMYCDKHVPKMCVEVAQMMASALRRHGATDEQMPLTKSGTPYKGGYAHHPCTVWAGDTRSNYVWLAQHGDELCREYSKRFGKAHACHDPIGRMSGMLVALIPDHDINRGTLGLTQFALAMPDEYRPEPVDGEVVYHAYPKFAIEAYRRYYHSKQFAKWEKGTPTPDWWRGVEVTA